MKIVLFALLTSLGFSAFAGDAGCGLGSMIISRNSKLLQLFAMTTNASTTSQALGITFGTSNCSANGIVMNEKQIQYFVEINQGDISREMAQGSGDKLATLALLHGCGDESAQQNFSSFAQQSYSKIVSSEKISASELIANLRSEMKGHTGLIAQCHGS